MSLILSFNCHVAEIMLVNFFLFCCYGRCLGLEKDSVDGGTRRMNLMMTTSSSLLVFLRALGGTSARKSSVDLCRAAAKCYGTFREVTIASTKTTSDVQVSLSDEIEDRSLHERLRDDLVEHLWAIHSSR